MTDKNPDGQPPAPEPDTMVLTQRDPTELLHELAEMERQCRNAEDAVGVAKTALKLRERERDEHVAALRKLCREIDAPPMPLFDLEQQAPPQSDEPS